MTTDAPGACFTERLDFAANGGPSPALGLVAAQSRGGLSDTRKIVTYPLIPEPFMGSGAVANGLGTRLSLFTDRNVFVVDLKMSAALESARSGLAPYVYKRVPGTSASAPWGRRGEWGFFGNFTGQDFVGQFLDEKDQALPGSYLKLQEISPSIWRGTCDFGSSQIDCWPDLLYATVQVEFSPDLSSASFGQAALRAVDASLLDNPDQIKDVMWHPSSPDDLFVLTSDKLRHYDLARSFSKPILAVDLSQRRSPAIRLGKVSGEFLASEEDRSVYVMYINGAIDYISFPVHMALAEDLAHQIRLQQLCPSPGAPTVRYAKNIDQAINSDAFDFCLFKLDDALVLHRTWASGHLDVVLCKRTPSEPDSFTPSKELAIQGTPLPRGASLSAKLKRLPKQQQFLVKIIKCVALWKPSVGRPGEPGRTNPFIYHCGRLNAHFHFVITDGATGHAILMKSTWCESGPSANGDVPLMLTLLTSFPSSAYKQSQLVLAEATGLVHLLGRNEAGALQSIDLVRYAREWTLGPELQRIARIATGSDGKEVRERLKVMLTTTLGEEAELIKSLRTALQAFINHIPSEIGSMVVDKQPEDADDTVRVLEWLKIYYDCLTGESEDGRRGVAAELERLGVVLADALKNQRSEVKRQRKELDEHIELMRAIRERTDAMQEEKPTFDKYIQGLRELTSLISNRLREKRHKCASVTWAKRLRDEYTRLESARQALLRAQARLKSLKERLSQSGQQHGPHPALPGIENEAELQELSSKILTLNNIMRRSEIAVEATRGACSSKHFEVRKVALVGYKDVARKLDEYDDGWKHDLKVGIKPRFFLERTVLSSTYQDNVRRKVDRKSGKYMHVPVVASVQGPIQRADLVILGEDVKVLTQGSRGHYYISRELWSNKGRVILPCYGDHVEIAPCHLWGSDPDSSSDSPFSGAQFSAKVLAFVLGDDVDGATSLMARLALERRALT